MLFIWYIITVGRLKNLLNNWGVEQLVWWFGSRSELMTQSLLYPVVPPSMSKRFPQGDQQSGLK